MSATGESGLRFPPQAGTTLIEALAVVAITTLIALIGFPRMQQSLLTLSQRQTVAVVASRLREARAEALKRDRPAAFSVAADGRVYGASVGEPATAPLGVTLALAAAGSGRIVFYGDGSSSGGQVLVRTAQRTIAVRVVPQTGVVIVDGR